MKMKIWSLAGLLLSSARAASEHPPLYVMRDVCVDEGECFYHDGKKSHSQDNGIRFVGRKDVEASAIARTYAGVTAVISAMHHESYDWSNYGHWMEVPLC